MEKTKKIRATLTIEVDYDNELLNYGHKLQDKLRQVINNTDFLCCDVVSGDLKPSKMPVITEKRI